MATISRIGFGQVEPNHLSAQRTGQIYAQLPADKEIEILENGQFAKYDYQNGVVNFDGEGEWMLVLNEVKLYGTYIGESYKDFAMKKTDYVPGTYLVPDGEDDEGNAKYKEVGADAPAGVMVPRLFKTNIGDIFTTNCLEQGNTNGRAKIEGTEDIKVGTKLSPNEDGYLSTSGDGSIEFVVVKVYTMPDGQQGVKVQRIA